MGRRHVRVPLRAGRRGAGAALAALLAATALAGCSPESERAADEAPSARGEVATSPPPSAQKPSPPPRTTAASAAPAAVAAGTTEPAPRCGWLMNPTPGNWWLHDRDGEWILASQGSEPAPGMDDMPDMSTSGWVETNGHYGYGCACVTIAYEPGSRRVTRAADFRPKPLKLCRDDKRLPRPD